MMKLLLGSVSHTNMLNIDTICGNNLKQELSKALDLLIVESQEVQKTKIVLSKILLSESLVLFYFLDRNQHMDAVW